MKIKKWPLELNDDLVIKPGSLSAFGLEIRWNSHATFSTRNDGALQSSPPGFGAPTDLWPKLSAANPNIGWFHISFPPRMIKLNQTRYCLRNMNFLVHISGKHTLTFLDDLHFPMLGSVPITVHQLDCSCLVSLFQQLLAKYLICWGVPNHQIPQRTDGRWSKPISTKTTVWTRRVRTAPNASMGTTTKQINQ